MTTPLKALIQERLRAKIVRQEIDSDELLPAVSVEVDDLAALERNAGKRSPPHSLMRQRLLDNRHSAPHQVGLVRGRQGSLSSSSSHHDHHKHHKHDHHRHHHHHNKYHYHDRQHAHDQQQHHQIDCYTYEDHHQKHDGRFGQGHSFDRGFYDGRYKGRFYEREVADQDELGQVVSPVASAQWTHQRHQRGLRDSASEGQKYAREALVHTSTRYEAEYIQSQQRCIDSVTSDPRRQEQQNDCGRDSRVHPVKQREETHGTIASSPQAFTGTAFELLREIPPDAYDAELNLSRNERLQDVLAQQRLYFQGRFESPADSEQKISAKYTLQQQQRQQQRQQRDVPDSYNLKSPHQSTMRKRDHDSILDKPHRAITSQHDQQARRRYCTESHLTINTDVGESELHIQQRELFHQQQQNERLVRNALRHIDMAASPLAAASTLAPLVFAAATSPRLETKRSTANSAQRKHNYAVGDAAASHPAAALSASLGAPPAPLDLSVIEGNSRLQRREEEASNRGGGVLRAEESHSFPDSARSNSNGANTNDESSSSSSSRLSDGLPLRRVQAAVLSPGCHRAATAFVEKRRKRTSKSTPRTMATQRWLQSMDPLYLPSTITTANSTGHNYQNKPNKQPGDAQRSASVCSSSSVSSATSMSSS